METHPFFLRVLRYFSPLLGFELERSDAQAIHLNADATVPFRGIGRLFVVIALLPFHSDLFMIPGDLSVWNGYDFFNHPGAIALRLCIAIPGLWILLIYSKVTRCQFDLTQKRYRIVKKSYISQQINEGDLSDIADIAIAPATSHGSRFLGRVLLMPLQVTFQTHTGQAIHFTVIEHRDRVEGTQQQLEELLRQNILTLA